MPLKLLEVNRCVTRPCEALLYHSEKPHVSEYFDNEDWVLPHKIQTLGPVAPSSNQKLSDTPEREKSIS